MTDYNEIFDYPPEVPHFRMDVEEISTPRVEASFILSSSMNINNIRNSFNRTFQDCDFEERENVITVSGYPPRPNYGEDEILATVKKYDPGAQPV